MSTVKRLFLYIVSITGLTIFASGAANLLSMVFDLAFRGDRWHEAMASSLSLGLAMLVIGGVLWFVFWRVVQKGTDGNPSETGSGIRKLYLNGILVVTAIMGLVSLSTFFGWIIAGTPYTGFPSENLGVGIVTVLLWLYHSRIDLRDGYPSDSGKTLRRWYLYILSAFGLIALSVNFISMISSSVHYLTSGDGYVMREGLWHGVLAENVSWLLVSAGVWWYFWFREAKTDPGSTLRQVYLYLLTIAGAAVTFLVGLANTLYKLFSFAFDSSADIDFSFLGWSLPLMLVAAAVWIYHRKVVQEEAETLTLNKLSPRRLHLYLMSFIGLGTTLSGIVYLFSLLLDLLFDAASSVYIYAAGWWSGQISLSLALLLAGVPVWLYSWRKIIQLTGDGGVAERSTVSRRIYVYGVLGCSIIASVVTLVLVVYNVIESILQGAFETESLQNIIWSLSVFLTSIPVLIYHWRLLREDQSFGAEKTGRKKRVTVIAGEGNDELIHRIEKHLGYRVGIRTFTGEPVEGSDVMAEEDIQKIAEEIAEADGNGVILDLTGNTVRILPYRD